MRKIALNAIYLLFFFCCLHHLFESFNAGELQQNTTFVVVDKNEWIGTSGFGSLGKYIVHTDRTISKQLSFMFKLSTKVTRSTTRDNQSKFKLQVLKLKNLIERVFFSQGIFNLENTLTG